VENSSETKTANSASFCGLVRAECDPIWQGLHAHPFISEIAAGTLPLEKFRFFLEQDLMYLKEYARCIAMGVVKSESLGEMSSFSSELSVTLAREIPNNERLLEEVMEMGAADRDGLKAMAPANLAYTSYMTTLGLRGGTLEITAALLPCAWSYMEIAQELAPEQNSHPIYGGWIGLYTSPEYLALVGEMKDEFDARIDSEDPNQVRLIALREIFANSSRLERGFWDMAYDLEQWPDLVANVAAGVERDEVLRTG
jgi:thiaminase (transcriptional activator TenA)